MPEVILLSHLVGYDSYLWRRSQGPWAQAWPSGGPFLCTLAVLTTISRGLSLHFIDADTEVNMGDSQLLKPVIFFDSRMCFVCSCWNISASLLINVFLHLHLLYLNTSAGILISSCKKEIWPRFTRFSLWYKMFQFSHAKILNSHPLFWHFWFSKY